jgi:hypothetical protein
MFVANNFYSSLGSFVDVERQYHRAFYVRVAPLRDLNSLKKKRKINRKRDASVRTEVVCSAW